MYATTLPVDSVIDALKAFITPFMPDDAQIVRGQVNRVPLPPEPCAVLTEIIQNNLQMTHANYVPPTLPIPAIGEAVFNNPKRIDIQIDFYGEAASDWCQTVKTAFASLWGFDQFPVRIKPLYTSDGIQSPMITGEQQYQTRWTLTASLQYNPTVSVPQDFAEIATPIVNVPADLT